MSSLHVLFALRYPARTSFMPDHHRAMVEQHRTDQSPWGLLLILNPYTYHTQSPRLESTIPLVLSPWLGAVPSTISLENNVWGL